MAQELALFGIRVVIVEPGVTKSAIFAKSVDYPNTTGAYEAPYQRMFQMYATGIPNATDPFEVAEVIHHAVTTDEPRLRYVTSGCRGAHPGRDRMTDADWVALGAARRRRLLRPLRGAVRPRHPSGRLTRPLGGAGWVDAGLDAPTAAAGSAAPGSRTTASRR